MRNSSMRDSLNKFDGYKTEEGDDVIEEPYCKCPLGFHGQFCEKAVDVQVINEIIIMHCHPYFEYEEF